MCCGKTVQPSSWGLATQPAAGRPAGCSRHKTYYAGAHHSGDWCFVAGPAAVYGLSVPTGGRRPVSGACRALGTAFPGLAHVPTTPCGRLDACKPYSLLRALHARAPAGPFARLWATCAGLKR